MLTRYRISVRGIVQGVGFRPFVKRLADRLTIPGTVTNTAGGVLIYIDTDTPERAESFASAIRSEAPPIARLESLSMTAVGSSDSYETFTIVPSEPDAGGFTLIPADVAVCPDCLREIFDPADRRYGYPFTNCTNCGPRYSITKAVPYDRVNTTMAPFRMCPQCLLEYENPEDRRFHAEPNACPVCGPQLDIPLETAISSLRAGTVVAIRGLGGFQLACDATSEAAVDRLRVLKRRIRKPFAVMMRDIETVARYCELGARETGLLTSRAAPIVLLRRLPGSVLPASIAPGLKQLGVMLPSTPLHHLLFRGGISVLVMTSGNISGTDRDLE